MSNIQALHNKAGKLQRELDQLSGMQQQLISKKAEKLLELEESTSYLDSSAEVLNALTEIHTQAQQKSKNLYENLLTTQLRELMPHNRECERVVLNNYIRKARPALSVEVETSNGHMRDIYDDKGGSIESVVAVGLRFICLSRTANRRFLVFDEADAGLSERYMPQFASMLEQLATQIGVQVVYITHKPQEMFEGKGRVIELNSKNGHIQTEIVSDYKFEGNTDGVNDDMAGDFFEDTGIEYIRIVNGKQHENTMIELCPYVNYIIGDNDIGKTSVTQMIEAVALNKGREGLIRDGEDYCSVQLGIEGDMTLEFRYNRAGAKKTSYKLSDSEGNIVHHSDSGTNKPEWLDEYLAMPLVNGVDIHISDQHNSSFILDKKYSEHQRAEMLNIDDDASVTQKMIARHNEITNHHKAKCRSLHTEIGQIKSTLDKIRMIEVAKADLDEVITSLKDAADLESGLSKLTQLADGLESTTNATNKIRTALSMEVPKVSPLKEMESIRETATTMINTDKKVVALRQVANTSVPSLGNLLETEALSRISSGIESSTLRVNKLKGIAQIEVPKVNEYHDGSELISLGKQIASAEMNVNHLQSVKGISTPTIEPILEMSAIRDVGAQMVKLSTKENNLRADLNHKQGQLETSQKAIENALQELDYCPLCKTAQHKNKECA
ncbi:hypothetical protein [Vibrio owensii]|uniref:hypothetical protein n=1 Tax=Vibrio owensii TaxID=696485 RepID=UPI003CC5119C